MSHVLIQKKIAVPILEFRIMNWQPLHVSVQDFSIFCKWLSFFTYFLIFTRGEALMPVRGLLIQGSEPAFPFLDQP